MSAQGQSFSPLLELQENRRLRFGVYLILALLWIYGITALRDLGVREANNWKQAEADILQARTVAATADWTTREMQARNALTELEGYLWRDGSLGFSQAAFQERIAQTLSRAGAVAPSIRVSAGSDAGAAQTSLAISTISARIQTEYRPNVLFNWLRDVALRPGAQQPLILVDSIVIRAQPNQPATLDLQLSALASRSAGSTADGNKPREAVR
jgi:hypothetical protein